MNFKIDYDIQPIKFLKSQDKTVIKRIIDKIMPKNSNIKKSILDK